MEMYSCIHVSSSSFTSVHVCICLFVCLCMCVYAYLSVFYAAYPAYMYICLLVDKVYHVRVVFFQAYNYKQLYSLP